MKIIVVASLAYSLINFRGRLIAAMIENGHEVLLCAPDHDPEIEARLKAMGATYLQMPMARAGMNPFIDIWTLAWLVRCFWRERPQAVLAYTQKPIIYGGIASRLFHNVGFYAMVSGLGHVFSDGGSRLLACVRTIVSVLYRLVTSGRPTGCCRSSSPRRRRSSRTSTGICSPSTPTARRQVRVSPIPRP